MQTKVFISYSWSSPEHEDWVINLAQRLVNNGIDVVIDKWDLKEGHDKYTFMESMVNSKEITKVLIILDKKYCDKANERDGGVGTETLIISPEIYGNVSQEKFVPIVSELDDNGKPYIPTYLSNRIYIDLSSNDHYEVGYEKLLRNILERPSLVKPKLGKIPSYILDETPMNFKTTAIVRGFDSQMDKHPERINQVARDFLEDFYTNLKDFKIINISSTIIDSGKTIFENINQYTPLRDDYISFISKVSKGAFNFDSDILIRFFEQLPLLFYPSEVIGSYYSHQFDNFRFIVQELFIYTVAVLLKNEDYKLLEDIIDSQYFIYNRSKLENQPMSYSYFYKSIDSFSAYHEQLSGRKVFSSQADLMVNRIPNNLDKGVFIDGDLFCYYIGLLKGQHWFPLTYIYKDEYSTSLTFFNRLLSKKYFDKVSSLIGFQNVDALKDKLKEIQSKENDNARYTYGRSRITPLSSIIDADKIASLR